jgi:hypothetical protein
MVSRGQILASPREVILRDPSVFVPESSIIIVANGRKLSLLARRITFYLLSEMGWMYGRS